MIGSPYEDIYATKGIEYLLVLAFLVALILFWRFLSRTMRPAAPSSADGTAGFAGWFSLAPGFFYHQGHTWAMPEDGEIVRIGLDDFAQKLIGKPGAVDLPPLGSRVEQGETGCRIRIDSKAVEIVSPIDGEVVAWNDAVVESPGHVNQDPYGAGWLMRVKVPNLKRSLKNLLSGGLAGAWMRNTEEILRLRMAGAVGFALQDGGIPLSGMARAIAPEDWDQVVREFLLTEPRAAEGETVS